VKDPLAKLMVAQGVPHEPDVMNPSNILIFSFPKMSPITSVFRNDISAIDQLNHYKMIRDEWCEHNPSITVYVRPDEWLDVGSWVYKNWDDVGGIAFLPHSDHNYQQAPFTEIGDGEYHALEAQFPQIDFSQLVDYEIEDTTTSMHDLACSAGSCSIL
jgi:ribonucleoside-triphosphate reductase